LKLLDTSVAVDHLRGYAPATDLLADLLRSEEPVVGSELTRFELAAGARRAEHDQLDSFFAVLDWIPVTEGIARSAGAYARAFRRSSANIGVVDFVLAGTVSVLGADLLTTNVRHFPMFEGLRPPYQYGVERRP